MSWTAYLAAFALGYLLGSIPFGLVLTRLAGTQDIRAIGSGSIGATNVLRTGRKGVAAATLLLDVLKGTLAVVLADWLSGRDVALVAGLGVSWIPPIAFAVIWLVVAGLTRYSSLASLTACAATPAVLWGMGNEREALLFLLLSVLAFIAHRANIARLMNRSEGKINLRKA